MCPVSKDKGRNRREIMNGFREVVGTWLLSHLLLQKCSDGKQALLVLLVDGECKLDQGHVSEVRG